MSNRLRHRYRTDQRGFTIAETLVVIAVFGVIAAIAVPQYAAWRPYNRLNGATRQVYSWLMWARAKAVNENSSYVITFPNDRTMQIVGSSTTTIDIQSDYVDVTLSSSAPAITYSSRGTSDISPTITLTNPGGSKTITLRVSGSATIS